MVDDVSPMDRPRGTRVAPPKEGELQVKRTFVVVGAALVLALLVAACGSSSSSSSSSSSTSGNSSKQLKLAYLSFAVANSYDAPMLAAAQAVAGDNNAKITV